QDGISEDLLPKRTPHAEERENTDDEDETVAGPRDRQDRPELFPVSLQDVRNRRVRHEPPRSFGNIRSVGRSNGPWPATSGNGIPPGGAGRGAGKPKRHMRRFRT